MAHAEMRRDGNHTVVLCIHGILGTPDHFSDFFPVIPNNWGIVSLLLTGHGKKVEDFSKATMSQWKKQVADEIAILEGKYEKILLIAHSMGCLFALEQALSHKKIEALFLLAPPLKPTLRFSIVNTSIKLLFSLDKESDPLTQATRKAYSIEISRKLWLYLPWIPNYISLFQEISRIRPQLQKINQPVWVYFSKKDELVKCSSRQYLTSTQSLKFQVLPKSAHFYYDTDDFMFLLQEFKTFLLLFQDDNADCGF